jgi:hypothetical protein
MGQVSSVWLGLDLGSGLPGSGSGWPTRVRFGEQVHFYLFLVRYN